MFEAKPPIRSSKEDEHALAADLDRFVVGLAERIDLIQDAELARKVGEVAELCRSLSIESDRLGYPGLAMSAKCVSMAAMDDSTDTLQETIIEMTEIAQRIRQGHRGAA